MPIAEGTRSPNRKGEGARLRDELVDAALRLIDGEGFETLSLRAIARGAGITAPSVYLHFTKLDALITAVVARCFDELITEITTERDAHRDPRGRLLASCRGYLRYAEHFPGRYALLFGRVTVADGTEDIGAHPHHDGSQRAFAILLAAVAACLDPNDDTALQAQRVAVAVWVGLDGFANLRLQRPGFPWPNTETMLESLVLDHIRPAP